MKACWAARNKEPEESLIQLRDACTGRLIKEEHGMGQIAVSYGHQRFNPDVTWCCVFLTVIIVQIIQEAGTWIAHKTDKRYGE